MSTDEINVNIHFTTDGKVQSCTGCDWDIQLENMSTWVVCSCDASTSGELCIA